MSKIDEIHPVLGCQRTGDILCGDDAFLDEVINQVEAPCAIVQFLDLLCGHQADILEDLDHIFIVGRHRLGKASGKIGTEEEEGDIFHAKLRLSMNVRNAGVDFGSILHYEDRS